MNQYSKKYYKQIQSLIPCRGKYERQLLKTYKNRILELNTNNPNISYNDLQKELGTPIEIIDEYYTNVDILYLIKKIQIMKWIKIAILIILLAIIIALTIFGITTYKTFKIFEENEIFFTETIIE